MLLQNKLQQIRDLYTKVSKRRKTQSNDRNILKKRSTMRLDKQTINSTDVDEAIKDRKKKSSFNLKTVIFTKKNKLNGHYLNKIVEKV